MERASQLSDEYIPENIDIVEFQKIATRALILFAICMLSCTETPKKEVVQWIKNNNLWESLSPKELAFIKADRPTNQQLINFSWQVERLHVLSWSLGITPQMVPANEQSSVADFQKAISRLNNETAKHFLETSKLRDKIEILEAADEIESLHWEARNANINKCQQKKHVDIEIIQERHHAINWILWGEVEEWDEVNTDT